MVHRDRDRMGRVQLLRAANQPVGQVLHRILPGHRAVRHGPDADARRFQTYPHPAADGRRRHGGPLRDHAVGGRAAVLDLPSRRPACRGRDSGRLLPVRHLIQRDELSEPWRRGA